MVSSKYTLLSLSTKPYTSPRGVASCCTNLLGFSSKNLCIPSCRKTLMPIFLRWSNSWFRVSLQSTGFVSFRTLRGMIYCVIHWYSYCLGFITQVFIPHSYFLWSCLYSFLQYRVRLKRLSESVISEAFLALITLFKASNRDSSPS